MWRTYLRNLILTEAIATTALMFPRAYAAQGLFNSQPVPQDKFIVLARPISRTDWTLLVLEQLKPQPCCWSKRPDGLVDPSLNRFDFTGICSRYLDSNGYSLRSGGEDLGSRLRLRLRQQGGDVLLETSQQQQQRTSVVVGRALIPQRGRHGFVSLRLNPVWRLERRVDQGKPLNHLYFAHRETFNRLLAMTQPNRPSGLNPLGNPIAPPPLQPLALGGTRSDWRSFPFAPAPADWHSASQESVPTP